MRFRKNPRPARWLEGAIVYQIYPRSFYDSDSDGIGDIPGITAKLKYLESLGINAIWLSPFYPSPMADFGYDVSNYCDVDPIFGKLADFDKLLAKAHARGIKIIIDFVPNHSSDQHPWFQQSRASRDNPYADWYIWRDPKATSKDGVPVVPNNWINVFSGGTAWEWEPARQQFYLHSFDTHQPDLNWENPDVREAMKQAMRFWLDRGVDGFRVDAVNHMGKDRTFPDEPRHPDYDPVQGETYGALKHVYTKSSAIAHAYLQEMVTVLKEEPYRKSLRFMVTEAYPESNDPVTEYLSYYEALDPAVASPFNFEGLLMEWDAKKWHDFLKAFHDALARLSPLCVASYAFGNHDQTRLATRLGDPAARAAAVLLLTLPGMAYIYNGEEIGMTNGKIPPELIQDPGAKGGEGRDPVRTPLQWSAEKNAGFTKAEQPWLPVNEGYAARNIKAESRDPNSYLALYKSLCKLRNRSPALRSGTIGLLPTGQAEALAYTRTVGGKGHLVVVNFGETAAEIQLPANMKVGRFQISSEAATRQKHVQRRRIELLPFEAAVFTVRL